MVAHKELKYIYLLSFFYHFAVNVHICCILNLPPIASAQAVTQTNDAQTPLLDETQMLDKETADPDCRVLQPGVTNVVTLKELVGNKTTFYGEYDHVGKAQCFTLPSARASEATHVKIEGFSRFDNETMDLDGSYADVQLFSPQPAYLLANKLQKASAVDYEYFAFCSWLYNYKTPGGQYAAHLRCPLHSTSVSSSLPTFTSKMGIQDGTFEFLKPGMRDAENLCMLTILSPLEGTKAYTSTILQGDNEVFRLYITFRTPEVNGLNWPYRWSLLKDSPKSTSQGIDLDAAFTPTNPSCYLFESAKMLEDSIHEQVQTNTYKFRADVMFDPVAKALTYRYIPADQPSRKIKLDKDYVTFIRVETPKHMLLQPSVKDSAAKAAQGAYTLWKEWSARRLQWHMPMQKLPPVAPNSDTGKAYLVLKGIASEEANSVAIVSHSSNPFGKLSFEKAETAKNILLPKSDKGLYTRREEQWVLFLNTLDRHVEEDPFLLKRRLQDEDWTKDDSTLVTTWVAIFPGITKSVTAQVFVADSNSINVQESSVSGWLIFCRVFMALAALVLVSMSIAYLIAHFCPDFRFSSLSPTALYRRYIRRSHEATIQSEGLMEPLDSRDTSYRQMNSLCDDEDVWRNRETEELPSYDVSADSRLGSVQTRWKAIEMVGTSHSLPEALDIPFLFSSKDKEYQRSAIQHAETKNEDNVVDIARVRLPHLSPNKQSKKFQKSSRHGKVPTTELASCKKRCCASNVSLSRPMCLAYPRPNSPKILEAAGTESSSSICDRTTQDSSTIQPSESTYARLFVKRSTNMATQKLSSAYKMANASLGLRGELGDISASGRASFPPSDENPPNGEEGTNTETEILKTADSTTFNDEAFSRIPQKNSTELAVSNRQFPDPLPSAFDLGKCSSHRKQSTWNEETPAIDDTKYHYTVEET